MKQISGGCWFCTYGLRVGRVGFIDHCAEHEQDARDHWEEMRELEPEMVQFFEKYEQESGLFILDKTS